MDNPRVIAGGYELLTPEAKVARFRARTVEERYHVFESYLEMIMGLRPDLVSNRHAAYPQGSVRVVRLPRR
ncbi:MAG: hypothetical protein FJX74_03825 [Armatimonadetes bacterium]|nr:hypothetical protein [Armatimonadota bacterium]